MEASLCTRESTAVDAETIVRHRRLMFEETGFSDAGRLDEMDSHVRALLLEMIPSGEYRGWMVEDGSGAVIAGAGLSIVRLLGKPFNPAGAYAYLMSLYVEPAYRRRGIARRLIATMVDWARREGISVVKLHASSFGRTLYEEFGFQQTNEMRLMVKREV